ncbi:MAG: hypothetical protein ACPH7H_06890 [Porticoccaceae bacterium]
MTLHNIFIEALDTKRLIKKIDQTEIERKTKFERLNEARPNEYKQDQIDASIRREILNNAYSCDDVDETLKPILKTLVQIIHNAWFLDEVLDMKISLINESIKSSITEFNPLGLVNNGRSLFEHIYMKEYLNSYVCDLYEKLEGLQSKIKIEQAIEKCDRSIKKMFTGKVHVNDCLKAFDKKFNGASAMYDELSNYLHPNYESYKFLTNGELGSGSIGITSKENIEHMITICNRIVFHLESFSQSSIEMSLAALSSLLHNFSSDYSKISNIFVVFGAFRGDGKSRDTALFFYKSRSHSESIRASLKYLEKRKIEVFDREIVDFDKGYMFEKYTTKNGDLWVMHKNPFE